MTINSLEDHVYNFLVKTKIKHVRDYSMTLNKGRYDCNFYLPEKCVSIRIMKEHSNTSDSEFRIYSKTYQEDNHRSIVIMSWQFREQFLEALMSDLARMLEVKKPQKRKEIILAFGKYKGQNIQVIKSKDMGYINWCIENISNFKHKYAV